MVLRGRCSTEAPGSLWGGIDRASPASSIPCGSSPGSSKHGFPAPSHFCHTVMEEKTGWSGSADSLVRLRTPGQEGHRASPNACPCLRPVGLSHQEWGPKGKEKTSYSMKIFKNWRKAPVPLSVCRQNDGWFRL